jgi:hypothetical protein
MSEPKVYRPGPRHRVFRGGNINKVSKEEAGYVGPEISIRCGTCYSYANKGDAQSPCNLVQGTVDAMSCCNLWTTDGKISTKFLSGQDAVKKLFG